MFTQASYYSPVVTNQDNTITSLDILEIEFELTDKIACGVWTDEDRVRLDQMRDVIKQGRAASARWDTGVLLVRTTHIQEYLAKQKVIRDDLSQCHQICFDGATYWILKGE